ncbi:MAG TPA: amidohydrolase family protein [Candidatus Limnocylindrales bacterium]|nr:amidohydrolase family protein [Candidatus Limnocylindrales bacterium]
MIDLQVNGAAGVDLTTEPERVWEVGEVLPEFGVTAFLPTLVSPSWPIVDRARGTYLEGPPPGYTGAAVLGWHVEGPFLAPSRAGAHDPASLRAPDPGAVRDWSPATGVRVATLAPELPGALGVVEALIASGVVVSAGHSAATAAEASAGFDAGIRMVTHLFNAMSPLDHREPGLPGAALLDDRVTVALLADGLHLAPAMVALVRRLVGRDRLAIVSDAIQALGMPPGVHQLAGRKVIVDESSARLENGVLAGCIIGLEEGVSNLAAFAGISLGQARLAATTVPARLLGLEWPSGARATT